MFGCNSQGVLPAAARDRRTWSRQDFSHDGENQTGSTIAKGSGSQRRSRQKYSLTNCKYLTLRTCQRATKFVAEQTRRTADGGDVSRTPDRPVDGFLTKRRRPWSYSDCAGTASRDRVSPS